jgi:ATP-binding cassette subfamily C protein LapB
MSEENTDKVAIGKITPKKVPANEAVDGGDKGKSVDTLLECLVFLTEHYGRAKSAESIKAGLAYDEKGMGPQLFCDASKNIGLKTQITKKADFKSISAPALPAVLILKGGQACVLLAMQGNGKLARIFSPETGATKDVKIADLSAAYGGYVIYVHPQAEFTDPEAPDVHDVNRHWFWSIVDESKGVYGRVVVAAILINLFGLASPIFIMNVYDRVIPNNAVETGWVLGIAALTIFGFDFIMRTLRGYFIDLAGRRIDVIGAQRIYDQVLNMKLSQKPQSSGVFANMLREFDSVREFMTSASLTILVDLPFTFLFLFVIFLIGGPIALLLFFMILTVIGVGMLIQWPLRNVVNKSVHASEAKHGILIETINGLETIKAVSADGRMRARYGTHLGQSAAHAQKSRFLSGLGVNFASLLQQSASVIIVLMGMYLVQDASITMGGLIACVILGGKAIQPIGQVANILSRYHQSRGALRTLNDIMAQPVERPPSKQFLHRPTLQGKIAFDKVGFVYPGTERKVLDDISFKIEPGEKVAFIGRIGAGKSTIARLLLGLYEPAEGAIYADDTDYRQIDPADLRRNVAYIAQDVMLFRGTVRENITIGRAEVTEEDILKAAQASGVHEFVSRHPMGYDAPVGERGEGLSGGQRQAIALARAMLLRPNIMVCDEPTNAMDVQAEEAFTKHVQEQIHDKTFVLITHRHSLLKLVDRIVLMDQGKVILDGPRDKVIEALQKGEVKVREG